MNSAHPTQAIVNGTVVDLRREPTAAEWKVLADLGYERAPAPAPKPAPSAKRAARLAQIEKALDGISDISVWFSDDSLEVSGDRDCVKHALTVLGLRAVNPSNNLDDAHWQVSNRAGAIIGTYYAHDESAEFTVSTRKAG